MSEYVCVRACARVRCVLGPGPAPPPPQHRVRTARTCEAPEEHVEPVQHRGWHHLVQEDGAQVQVGVRRLGLLEDEAERLHQVAPPIHVEVARLVVGAEGQEHQLVRLLIFEAPRL